jgi:hypothetical protein
MGCGGSALLSTTIHDVLHLSHSHPLVSLDKSGPWKRLFRLRLKGITHQGHRAIHLADAFPHDALANISHGNTYNGRCALAISFTVHCPIQFSPLELGRFGGSGAAPSKTWRWTTLGRCITPQQSIATKSKRAADQPHCDWQILQQWQKATSKVRVQSRGYRLTKSCNRG